MARVNIPQYGASKQINPASAPNVQLSNAVGRAVSGLGSALEGPLKAIAQRKEDKENFQATNDYNALQQQLQKDMKDQYDNAEGDGEDFTADFVNNSYRTRRDAFMARVPERLKEKYGALLSDDPDAPGTDYLKFNHAAAENESQLRQFWYKDQIAVSQEQLATGIAMDPEGYEDFRQQGIALIEESGLHPSTKKAQLREWEKMAATAHLNEMMKTRPEEALRLLNADPRMLMPATKMAMLERAVLGVESAGDPNAVSEKGAVGLMQVMPATGAEIAKELGDKNFPKDTSTPAGKGAVVDYLKDPDVSRRYGRHYLQKQMKAFGSDMEAALIAYNGGPERAKAWLAAGRDDRAIPTESANYYKKVMAGLSSQASLDENGKPVSGTGIGANLPYASGRAKVTFTGGPKRPNPPAKPVMNALQTVADRALGSGFTVDIYSGTGEHGSDRHRDVHGAGGGLAADVTMKQANGKPATRAQMELFAKHWLATTGGSVGWGPDYMGVDRMHVDLKTQETLNKGQARTWGAYAKALDTKGSEDTRYASLSYKERQDFVNRAEAAVGERYKPTITPSMKGDMRRDIANELSLYAATGSGRPGFNEDNIVTVLGADDYSKYSYQRDIAERSFKATNKIKELPEDDMGDHLLLHKPLAGSDTFAGDQQVEAAVEKEIARVRKLRSVDPASAATEFPEEKKLLKEIEEISAAGKPVGPELSQEFVKQVLARQEDFAVPKSARAPIPRQWAISLGRDIVEAVPSIVNDGKVNRKDVRIKLAKAYATMEETWGPYTDEIIAYAVGEYKGIEKADAEMITQLMAQIGRGGDPFTPAKLGQAEQREKERGFWDFLSWTTTAGGSDEGEGDDEGDGGGLSTEELLRKREQLIREREALDN